MGLSSAIAPKQGSPVGLSYMTVGGGNGETGFYSAGDHFPVRSKIGGHAGANEYGIEAVDE